MLASSLLLSVWICVPACGPSTYTQCRHLCFWTRVILHTVHPVAWSDQRSVQAAYFHLHMHTFMLGLSHEVKLRGCIGLCYLWIFGIILACILLLFYGEIRVLYVFLVSHSWRSSSSALMEQTFELCLPYESTSQNRLFRFCCQTVMLFVFRNAQFVLIGLFCM